MSMNNYTVFKIPSTPAPKVPMPNIPLPSVPNPNVMLKKISNTYCGCENGSYSNLKDYYTAALLNIPDAEMYNVYTLNERIQKAKEHYKQERKKNSDGKLLEELQIYNTPEANLPDYTEEIDKWLAEQERYFDDQKHTSTLISKGAISEAAIFTKKFIEKVQTEGDMDIKQRKSWRKAFPKNMTYPENENKYFLYHGQVMDPGTLGNVAYAYIGAKYYSEFALYFGGAAVQVKRYNKFDLPYMPALPYMGDMSEDNEAIELGIKWRKEGFPSEQQIKERFEFEETLNDISEYSDINRG